MVCFLVLTSICICRHSIRFSHRYGCSPWKKDNDYSSDVDFQVSPMAMTNVTWRFYMLFVALNLVDFVIITLFFPETKGR